MYLSIIVFLFRDLPRSWSYRGELGGSELWRAAEHAEDFFAGCLPGADGLPGSLFEGDQALLCDQRLQSAGVGALQEGIDELLAVESEAFGEDETAVKACATAGAAGAVLSGRDWMGRTCAAAAEQPLAENEPQCAADEVGFELHFKEAGEGFDGGTCVECAEYEVAGEGGLENGFGSGGVANFTDEDHIGILPHEGSDASGEVETGIFADLRLSDSGERDFDGVFESHDAAAVAGLLEDFAKAGVGCGGFVAAGWPGEQDYAGGFGELCEQGLLEFVGQSQFVGQLQLVIVGEQTHGGFFAVKRGECGNANFLVAVFPGDSAFLRDFGAVCEESGEDFEASDETIAEFAVKAGDAVEHAVDAKLHAQPGFFGYEMHVAGALPSCFMEDQSGQRGHVGVVAG